MEFFVNLKFTLFLPGRFFNSFLVVLWPLSKPAQISYFGAILKMNEIPMFNEYILDKIGLHFYFSYVFDFSTLWGVKPKGKGFILHFFFIFDCNLFTKSKGNIPLEILDMIYFLGTLELNLLIYHKSNDVVSCIRVKAVA